METVRQSSAPESLAGAPAPELPPLSLGSWHTFDRIPYPDGVALITAALERSVNHFDVGVYDRYAPSFTDIIFSALIRGAGAARDDFQVSLKLWLSSYPEQALEAQLSRALERSGLDYADYVVLGEIPEELVPALPEIIGTLADLQTAGLIRGWAANNWPAAVLGHAMDLAKSSGIAAPPYAQVKYSVSRRAITDGAPYAELFGRGLRLEPSDVLEGGILAGSDKTDRIIGKDPGDVRGAILHGLPDYVELANSFGVSPAELAVAFVATHPAVDTVLLGATKTWQIDAALRSLALVGELGADRIRSAVEPFWADRDVIDPAS